MSASANSHGNGCRASKRRSIYKRRRSKNSEVEYNHVSRTKQEGHQTPDPDHAETDLDSVRAGDGRNDAGERISNGSYFYQLEIDGKTQVKKMVLVK